MTLQQLIDKLESLKKLDAYNATKEIVIEDYRGFKFNISTIYPDLEEDKIIIDIENYAY